MNRTANARPAALVTGASSGIGLELARLFARDGHDLVLVARSETKLAELAQELERAHRVRATVIVADLARPHAAAEVARRLESLGIAVDILVNNAGYGLFGPFAGTPLAAELDMIQVNIVAPTELTKLLLPAMLARRSGKIMNVASTAAFQPGPLMAVYYATKAYVLHFTEALAEELAGTGVVVSALCPGPTRSGFQAAAGLEVSKMIHGRRLPAAAAVARAGYEGLMRGRRVVVPGLANNFLALVVRILPRRAVTAAVHRYQAKVRA